MVEEPDVKTYKVIITEMKHTIKEAVPLASHMKSLNALHA